MLNFSSKSLLFAFCVVFATVGLAEQAGEGQPTEAERKATEEAHRPLETEINNIIESIFLSLKHWIYGTKIIYFLIFLK